MTQLYKKNIHLHNSTTFFNNKYNTLQIYKTFTKLFKNYTTLSKVYNNKLDTIRQNCTKPYITFTNFYTIPRILFYFTTLVNTLQVFFKENVPNSTQLYATLKSVFVQHIQDSAHVYKSSTQLYKTLHSITQLYQTSQFFTKLCATLQTFEKANCTQLYETSTKCTQLDNTLRHCAKLYTHNIKHYGTLENSTTL